MSRVVGVASLALLGVLADGLRAAPVAGKGGPAFYPLPWGGVVDASGRTGYVTGEKGTVEALDLATGKLLWGSAEATKPLALDGTRLLAQAPEKGKANAVRVVALDTRDKGKRLLRSDAVTFPDWVNVGLALGRSFSARAFVHKGDLYLEWTGRAWYAGGARPSPAVEKAARKHADGVARIDLKTGKVETVAKGKAPAAPAVKLPEGVEKAAARTVWVEGESRALVRTTAKYAVAADVEGKGAEQKLVLKRWDLTTGKQSPAVTLLTGKLLRVEWSADAETVLVLPGLAKSARPAGAYVWSAFSADTGKALCQIDYDPGATTASAVGGRAYFVVTKAWRLPKSSDFKAARVLVAIDLKTGKKLWDRPVEPARSLPLPP